MQVLGQLSPTACLRKEKSERCTSELFYLHGKTIYDDEDAARNVTCT